MHAALLTLIAAGGAVDKSNRKIYFAGSIRGGRQDVKLYRQLTDHMTKNYGTVLTEHVGEASLQSMGELGHTDKFIYERDMAWLRSSHAVVAEVTRPSLGVGYEIAYAEQLGLPVLCLYRPKANKGSRLSAMIGGSDKVINHSYKQRADAVAILDDFFKTIDQEDSLSTFLIPVQIRALHDMGAGHQGIFATAPVPKGSPIWEWTDRVEKIHHNKLEQHIQNKSLADSNFDIPRFLRQGFVLATDEDFFNSNPTDAGRLTNHACDPTCGPTGTLRDIDAGEEITLDYRNHGNPEWYQLLCAKYGVQTEAELGNRICSLHEGSEL